MRGTRPGSTTRVGDGEQTSNQLLSLHPMYLLRATTSLPAGPTQTPSPLIRRFKYLVKHARQWLPRTARALPGSYYMRYIRYIMSSIASVLQGGKEAEEEK